jgi:hypothetical protein
MPLRSKLFLLLSCGGFVALVEVSGESRYSVVRLLLDVISWQAHGYSFALEGRRRMSIERKSEK